MNRLEKGVSSNVTYLFEYLEDNIKNDIDEFVLNSLIQGYQRFSSVSEFRAFFYKDRYFTYEESLCLRAYSGTRLKFINDVLKDRWSFIDEDCIFNKDEFLKHGSKIRTIIEKNATIGVDNFITYRNLSLDYFKEYGITSVDELSYLNGKFLMDKGFICTSLLENDCFNKKDSNQNEDSNILIAYMVPSDFVDGIYIGGNPNLSYRPENHNYLINVSNLAKVTSVVINEDKTAFISAVMIPKYIYDSYYKKSNLSIN